jgi:hypothetical protein
VGIVDPHEALGLVIMGQWRCAWTSIILHRWSSTDRNNLRLLLSKDFLAICVIDAKDGLLSDEMSLDVALVRSTSSARSSWSRVKELYRLQLCWQTTLCKSDMMTA